MMDPEFYRHATAEQSIFSPYHRVYTRHFEGLNDLCEQKRGKWGGIAVAYFCTLAMRFMHRTQSRYVRTIFMHPTPDAQPHCR